MRELIAVSLGMLMAFYGTDIQADMIGYTAGISNSHHEDAPTFTFTNTSTATVDITNIHITIGQSGKNFDFSAFENFSPAIAFNLNSPDAVNGGVRSTFIDYDFASGFSSGNFFEFRADIDPDFFDDASQDFRSTLFNNGLEDNSTITVGFSNGSELALVLPDAPIEASYSFSQSAAVPEPSTFFFIALGFGGFTVLRRKRSCSQMLCLKKANQ